MTPLDSMLPAFWENAGFLIGLVLSLLILSFIIWDSWLVRAAQYLLVGVTLAYTVVLVWSNVLWPRLFSPLLTNPQPLVDSRGQLTPSVWTGWLPLVVGLLIWAGGIAYLRGSKGQSQSWLRHLTAAPLGLLVGVGLGAGIAGALQGTFLPQFQRAAEMGQFFDLPTDLWLVGMFTIAITGGALLHLQLGVVSSDRDRFPRLLRPFLAGWAWLGERALWLTAGVIFARLFASRTTLLISRLDSIFFAQPFEDLWRRLVTFWQGG